MKNGSWSVVSTIRAPRHQVDSFIRHYVDLGVDKIYIFFDDPKFSEFDKDMYNHKVHAVICSDTYWSKVRCIGPCSNHGERPDTIEVRQHINMLNARDKMSSDWILHVDVDELVYARKRVSEVLSAFPDKVFSVALRTLEAVYDHLPSEGQDFSTNLFRRFTRNDSILSKFFEDDVKAVSWGGFWGVTIGKTFVRKSPEIARMSVHRPSPLDANLYENVETDYLDMLHFEGQSFPAFREKSLLRIRQDVAKLMNSRFKKRLSLIKSYYDESGEKGLIDAYRKFYVIEGERLAEAMSLGFVVRIDWLNYAGNSDGSDLVSNPCHYRDQKISGWQGDILKTAHNKYLIAGHSSVIGSADPGQLTKPDAELVPVEIYQAYGYIRLLTRNEFGNLYATVQDDGSIVMQPSLNLSSRFEALQQIGDGVSLRFKGKYMSAGKDGSIAMSRELPLAWETFRVRRVYPQISFY